MCALSFSEEVSMRKFKITYRLLLSPHHVHSTNRSGYMRAFYLFCFSSCRYLSMASSLMVPPLASLASLPSFDKSLGFAMGPAADMELLKKDDILKPLLVRMLTPFLLSGFNGVRPTEYTQSGNCRFSAYFPSGWNNQPWSWLDRVGGARPPPFTLVTITYKVAVCAPT
jgi:hypothetical protein